MPVCFSVLTREGTGNIQNEPSFLNNVLTTGKKKANPGDRLLGHQIRFGYEKPAIPGPGRPRLPEGTKERRAKLRRAIEESAPDAIRVVNEILTDGKASDRDRLRAAEIMLTHSVPTLEEVDLHDDRPKLADITPELLAELIAGDETPRPANGNGSVGVPA